MITEQLDLPVNIQIQEYLDLDHYKQRNRAKRWNYAKRGPRMPKRRSTSRTFADTSMHG